MQGNNLGGSSQMISELWVSTVSTSDVRSELVFGRVVTDGIRAKVTPDSSSVYSPGRYRLYQIQGDTRFDKCLFNGS